MLGPNSSTYLLAPAARPNDADAGLAPERASRIQGIGMVWRLCFKKGSVYAVEKTSRQCLRESAYANTSERSLVLCEG